MLRLSLPLSLFFLPLHHFLLCLFLHLFSVNLPQLLELLEDVVVVHQCVRELVFEILRAKARRDTFLKDWRVENLVDVGPPLGVLHQQRAQQLVQLRRVLPRQFFILGLDDLLSQLVK